MMNIEDVEEGKEYVIVADTVSHMLPMGTVVKIRSIGGGGVGTFNIYNHSVYISNRDIKPNIINIKKLRDELKANLSEEEDILNKIEFLEKSGEKSLNMESYIVYNIRKKLKDSKLSKADKIKFLMKHLEQI